MQLNCFGKWSFFSLFFSNKKNVHVDGRKKILGPTITRILDGREQNNQKIWEIKHQEENIRLNHSPGAELRISFRYLRLCSATVQHNLFRTASVRKSSTQPNSIHPVLLHLFSSYDNENNQSTQAYLLTNNTMWSVSQTCESNVAVERRLTSTDSKLRCVLNIILMLFFLLKVSSVHFNF